MPHKTYAALDVAKFILHSAPSDADISNMKLQKLCYYAQGLVSAMRGTRLFQAQTVAWDHGPVVPELYHTFKHHGSQVIPPPASFDPFVFDEADRQAISDVLGHYGQFSAWALRNMTHNEKPWVEAYNQMQGSEISVDAMVEYFGPQIDVDYVRRVYGEIQAEGQQGPVS